MKKTKSRSIETPAAPPPLMDIVPASSDDPDWRAPQRIHSVIDLWLGDQIRHRRKALGQTLSQLATGCGVSVSLLSQIERGHRSISLRTLESLSSALRMPIESLVRNAHVAAHDDRDGTVVRSGQHQRIDLDKKGMLKENLTPRSAKGVEMYRAVIEPGGSTGDTLFATGSGGQIGYIVEGELELFIQGERLSLRTGDTFFYPSATPRRWRNPGTTLTTVVWALTRHL